MNIFGIGGTELVLIFLIALVVAGPKRMIEWAYHLGRYVAKFRQLWSQMMDVVQQEVDAAGLDVQVPKEIPTRQSINQTINKAAKPFTDPLNETLNEVRATLPSAAPSANNAMRPSEQLLAGRKPAAPAPASPAAPADAPPTASMGTWGNPGGGDPTPPNPVPNRFGTWSKPAPSSPPSEES